MLTPPQPKTNFEQDEEYQELKKRTPSDHRKIKVANDKADLKNLNAQVERAIKP